MPFQILNVHMFPATGAGLCCPSAIRSSWDAWHSRPLSVGGFEGGGVCFRLSCYLSDIYEASKSRRPNFPSQLVRELKGFQSSSGILPPLLLPDGVITVFLQEMRTKISLVVCYHFIPLHLFLGWRKGRKERRFEVREKKA